MFINCCDKLSDTSEPWLPLHPIQWRRSQCQWIRGIGAEINMNGVMICEYAERLRTGPATINHSYGTFQIAHKYWKKIKKTLWKINFSFYSLMMVFLWRTALFFLYIVRVAIFNLHAKSMWNGTPLIYLLTPWNGFLLAQHLLICIYSIRSGVSLVALPFPSAPGFLFIYTWRIARIPFTPDGTKSNCFIVIQ